jgi:hypothetical protein
MSLVAIQLNKEKISIVFSLHGITEQYHSFYIPFLFATTVAHHHHHHHHHHHGETNLKDKVRTKFFCITRMFCLSYKLRVFFAVQIWKLHTIFIYTITFLEVFG